MFVQKRLPKHTRQRLLTFHESWCRELLKVELILGAPFAAKLRRALREGIAYFVNAQQGLLTWSSLFSDFYCFPTSLVRYEDILRTSSL